jgi:hypothetical protein
MLTWYQELWLIDHGASLYFHHAWQNVEEARLKQFAQVKDHVLLPYAAELDLADTEFRSILNSQRIHSIVSLIPDEWLQDDTSSITAEEKRNVYGKFLETRVAHSEKFVKEAKHAREALI